MHLVPIGEKQNPLKHFHIGASLATFASVAFSAAGTGLVWMPVYAWAVGSALASVGFYNGTAGSLLFQMKVQAGGVSEINFWEDPTKCASNLMPVLESGAGIGVHDFHVWAMAVRSGAGDGALTL